MILWVRVNEKTPILPYVCFGTFVVQEYVVVLVSNGKCQSEVKSALEAFLGDSVTEFVSW